VKEPRVVSALKYASVNTLPFRDMSPCCCAHSLSLATWWRFGFNVWDCGQLACGPGVP
jgi:hypothetical protein